MSTQKSVLFVCTGNVFRSVSAELSLKKYLAERGIGDWEISSAGIVANPEPVDPVTLQTLHALGMDGSTHTQKRLTREMLDHYDVIVGMAEDHIEFMRSEFNYKYGILFNELAKNEKTSVTDDNEIPDRATNRPAVEEKIRQTVQEIAGEIPAVFERISERFYLFSDFVTGKTTTHYENKYPFIPLHETPHSVAFMSVDIPSTEDGHVLVIPKKRYPDLAEIPDEVLKDMLSLIKKIGSALEIEHDGYNVLLNNGFDAGQYIVHTHFHIIPRRRGDGIKVEGWGHPKISQEYFVALNKKLQSQINQTPSAS